MSFILSCIMLFGLNYLALVIYHKRHHTSQMMVAAPTSDVSLARRKKSKKSEIPLEERLTVFDEEGGAE